MLRNNDLESVVYKQVGPYSTLRQLVKVHAQIVRDVAAAIVGDRIRVVTSRGRSLKRVHSSPMIVWGRE
jgi:hypothetical protein